MNNTFKFIYRFCLYTIFSVLLIVISIDFTVQKQTEDHLFDGVESVPYNKVGLLLGTSKYRKKGLVNLYYKYRLNAAIKLFNSGKIDYILVSGDNATRQYDEPTTFKEDLVKRGIPASKIVLDYAGFRTLDSVVRCNKVFGQNSITVISQPFQNERAIFIAEKKGIEAVGFNAKKVSWKYGVKTLMREKLARVKMVLDLIFNKQPKFLGDEISIGYLKYHCSPKWNFLWNNKNGFKNI